MSYQVLQDWAALNIDSAILLKSTVVIYSASYPAQASKETSHRVLRSIYDN